MAFSWAGNMILRVMRTAKFLDLLGVGERFGLANGRFVQIVSFEGLAGPFAGPTGTHSLLRFREDIFGVLMCVVSFVVRFLHPLYGRHELGIDLRRLFLFLELGVLPHLFSV